MDVPQADRLLVVPNGGADWLPPDADKAVASAK